ncbi:MAG: UvrD-helicase domain-containing protein [Ktedonobacteraceae bacterium]
MAQQWQITMKPRFVQDIITLQPKEVKQVMEKVDILRQNPLADDKLKLKIKHNFSEVYRIRSGDYRILYKITRQEVKVLTVRRRKESTYKGSVDDLNDDMLDELDDLDDDDLDVTESQSSVLQPDWESYVTPQVKKLPEPITVELLNQLHVPPVYHRRLLPITNQEDLLACPGIPVEVLLQIDAYMFELPLEVVERQPDLILQQTSDLLRYKEGDLLAFLLKLSPEQEKFVDWALNSSGPTLVKGGPGTGKSTVALYRIRSMLGYLRKMGKSAPRLLFTTYTNALVRSSEQLLQQLLGNDYRFVTVRTADGIIYDILQESHQFKEIINDSNLRDLTGQAVKETTFDGNILLRNSQQQTIKRMGEDYLLQEFNKVIVARQLQTLEEYLTTSRSGRKMSLNQMQRMAVWKVYECWRELLLAKGKETWEQRRARAAEIVTQSKTYQRYDAVVIDEAQDLDPSVLRLLVHMSVSPSHLFITADANQSIYGGGFNWADVHQSLRFQGRTGILRANFRSTREIGEAAQSYLTTSGELETEQVQRLYVNSGTIPDMRTVLSSQQEARLLCRYFKQAVLQQRLTSGSCAVLCPTERAGQEIVRLLKEEGLEATFMRGKELDLRRSGVKVITLSSSKGLEFPIVALAGFVSSNYPIISLEASDDERSELLMRERRTMFVGMTRAMRALLVIVPAHTSSPLLQGFEARYWNLEQ